MGGPSDTRSQIPTSLIELSKEIHRLLGAANSVVENWSGPDNESAHPVEYHTGRRDALDVVLWLISEMLRRNPEL